MGKRHSNSFKLQAVEKALNRSHGQTLAEIAEHYSIGYSTLTRWMQDVKQGNLSEESAATISKHKRPQDWILEEKVQAIVDTERLSDEDKGKYCRSKGIYVHQLEDWKQALKNTQINKNDPKLKSENRALKAENKRLQKELARKEKALAEAAALIVLKKKAQVLFESGEED